MGGRGASSASSRQDEFTAYTKRIKKQKNKISAAKREVTKRQQNLEWRKLTDWDGERKGNWDWEKSQVSRAEKKLKKQEAILKGMVTKWRKKEIKRYNETHDDKLTLAEMERFSNWP